MKKGKDIKDYEDIIDLPRPIPKERRELTNRERAAQFAPFAALRGLDKKLEKARQEHIRRVENEIERVPIEELFME